MYHGTTAKKRDGTEIGSVALIIPGDHRRMRREFRRYQEIYPVNPNSLACAGPIARAASLKPMTVPVTGIRMCSSDQKNTEFFQ